MGNHPSLVVHDLVIQEDNCNLSCAYCLTGQSNFKQEHTLLRIFDPPRMSSCLPGTELRRRLSIILDNTADLAIPVVKISGGEVLLIRGILEFVQELSGRYETVVLLTNGSLCQGDMIEELRAMGNVVLQLSLDATSHAGNSYRVESAGVHDRLIKKIAAVLESGLPAEIYLVLTDRSVTTLRGTLEDLRPYAGRVTVFPFPVRGPDRDRFLPRPDQLGALRDVLDRQEDFAGLLAPAPYLARLWRFFEEGERTFRCHLPRIALGSFDDGVATTCPNIWFDRAGNFLEEAAGEVVGRVQNSKFRKLLLAERPRIEACRACFTPWDPISLFFDGELTLEEIARVPMYRGQRTIARLDEALACYRSERAHA